MGCPRQKPTREGRTRSRQQPAPALLRGGSKVFGWPSHLPAQTPTEPHGPTSPRMKTNAVARTRALREGGRSAKDYWHLSPRPPPKWGDSFP
eukprot:12487421-Alexandrium_andersonii.AAC.1